MVERYYGPLIGYEMKSGECGDFVRYCDYAALEGEIAELRAELNANPRWKPKAEELAVKLVAAEAENARLKALPLKDEVGRELADIEENLDDAVRYLVDLAGAKPSPMSPHNCRIYIDHARMGARNLAALLSRLRAGEQEGWRSMDSAPVGVDILVGGDLGHGWKSHVYQIRDEFWREDWEDEPTHWMPLPAAPSEQGGDRG